MIDVAAAIDAEAVPVTLTTTAAGSYDAGGNYVPGATATATIRAAMQPVTGQALKDMPEGIRTEAEWLVWSRSPLAADNAITAAGIDYRVLFVWPRLRDGFYRAAVGRRK